MAAVDGALVERLMRLGIFADLSEEELGAIVRELEVESFPEGRWILREGEAETALYVIVDGEVGVVIDDEERATLSTGSFFGEVSVLLDEPPTADVVTRTPVSCLVVPPARVEEFLLGHPRVMFRMLQTEARRLRSADRERN